MIYHRWSPTLGTLEDTAEKIWGTQEYEGDKSEPTVFFGLYGLPDFYALWRHTGKKWILWAGTDITHFKNGYWLEDGGNIRVDPKPLAEWINKNCESWVENDVEKKALEDIGIQSTVCPSFLGDVNQFELHYIQSDIPKLYTSVSGDNFKLYGWDMLLDLAEAHPNIEFHIYGSSINNIILPNVVHHGRVPKEQMNEEIKTMQGALRLTEFDGFSEILAKSVLMGQWPVSLIEYPEILTIDDIGTITDQKFPNIKGREYYLKHLNQFPWNLRK